jgi:hypothetical protein
MRHDRTSGRQPAGGLRQLHFELYRLMLARSWPGEGGRPVCSDGQAKLAARLGVSTKAVRDLIADLREPGADVRHPNAKPAGLRLGWLLVLPREVAGGRGGKLYGGNRYVLLVDDVDQLDALQRRYLGAEPFPQASEQMPTPDRREVAEKPVSPSQIEGKSEPASFRRYVRSNPGTGSSFTHPESGPTEADSQQPTRTNERPLAWEPPGGWSEEHRAVWVGQALARIRAGLHVHTGRPDGLDPATRERRALNYQARIVGEDLAAERARLQSGETPAGYPGFLPKWAEGGPPVKDQPDQGVAPSQVWPSDSGGGSSGSPAASQRPLHSE